MSAGELSPEYERPRLTITGEDVTAERAELLARLARALGHSDIAYTPGTIEDGPDELDRQPIPPGIDAIVQAHRLHFELPPNGDSVRVRDEQRGNTRRLGHQLIGSLIRHAASDYVRRDLPRAFGVVRVLASHEELADRSLAADMLDTAYREAVRSGQANDARSLHDVWRQLTHDPDVKVDTAETLGGLIDHMDGLIGEGRGDLRTLLDELDAIEGHLTHPRDDQPG